MLTAAGEAAGEVLPSVRGWRAGGVWGMVATRGAFLRAGAVVGVVSTVGIHRIAAGQVNRLCRCWKKMPRIRLFGANFAAVVGD